MKTCKNCAWYCHSDQLCYGTKARLYGVVRASEPIFGKSCEEWSFDGLDDWERDQIQTPSNTLVTMKAS